MEQFILQQFDLLLAFAGRSQQLEYMGPHITVHKRSDPFQQIACSLSAEKLSGGERHLI